MDRHQTFAMSLVRPPELFHQMKGLCARSFVLNPAEWLPFSTASITQPPFRRLPLQLHVASQNIVGRFCETPIRCNQRRRFPATTTQTKSKRFLDFRLRLSYGVTGRLG